MTALRKRLPQAAGAMGGDAVFGMEPTLGEMLDDPIVQLLMARDGVTRADVEELFAALHLRRRKDKSRPILRLSARTLQIPSLGQRDMSKGRHLNCRGHHREPPAGSEARTSASDSSLS